MLPDWRGLSARVGLRVDGVTIDVRFVDNGRRHTVRVEEKGESLRIWSIVARRSQLNKVADVDLRAWLRNWVTFLVGFKTDSRGRLIGEAWVPVEGLTAEEWAVYVSAVAQAADQFEYLLTGRDDE